MNSYKETVDIAVMQGKMQRTYSHIFHSNLMKLPAFIREDRTPGWNGLWLDQNTCVRWAG